MTYIDIYINEPFANANGPPPPPFDPADLVVVVL